MKKTSLTIRHPCFRERSKEVLLEVQWISTLYWSYGVGVDKDCQSAEFIIYQLLVIALSPNGAIIIMAVIYKWA